MLIVYIKIFDYLQQNEHFFAPRNFYHSVRFCAKLKT